MAVMHEIDVSLREPKEAARWARPRDRRRYESALAEAALAMRGHTWWHVNSASDGGGVAELLHALLGYVAGAGIDTRWLVIDGEPAFFEITKRIHNRLHGAPGDGGPLGPDERARYDATLARELEALGGLVRPGDVVVLHDPQTVGLTRGLLARGAHVIWVCHVGVDAPNELARDAWRFLLDDARSAEACVFTRAAYVWDGPEPARV
jgi:trehalose synthase